jgi:hypothetical protein
MMKRQKLFRLLKLTQYIKSIKKGNRSKLWKYFLFTNELRIIDLQLLTYYPHPPLTKFSGLASCGILDVI